jgi:hypothetical protein
VKSSFVYKKVLAKNPNNWANEVNFVVEFCVLAQLVLELKCRKLDSHMEIVKDIYNAICQCLKCLKMGQYPKIREVCMAICKQCNKSL